jgi:hypothetical protein
MPIVVEPGGFVEHAGRRYMLAAETAGRSGMLYLGPMQIRIVVGDVTGIFARLSVPPPARRASGQ